MNIKPTSLLRLARPQLVEIDGDLVLDNTHYTQNMVPTGRITLVPMLKDRNLWDVGDVLATTYLRSDYIRDFDHGHMFFSEGSFSMSAKNIGNGIVPLSLENFASLNRVTGHLYQFDGRLPTHFTSTLGVTQGKRFVCTHRGIMEVQGVPKRGILPGGDLFYPNGANNSLAWSTSAPDNASQQIILGETETEFFGLSWFDNAAGFIDGVGSSARMNTTMWRSTKRSGVIDNATQIRFAPTGDAYDLIYVGVFGDHMIAIRPTMASNLSQPPRQNEVHGVHPMAMNVKNGAISQAALASAVKQPTYPTSNAGFRFANHARAVVETETTISVYIPQVSASNSVSDGVLTGMLIRRYDFNKTTEQWSNTDVTIADGPYGDVMVKGNSVAAGTHAAQSLLTSWIIEVQDEKYLVVMHMGTNGRLDPAMTWAASHEEYTHQYVYRIEANGSLTRVTKLIQPMLFGRNEVNAGFAMSPDRKALYMNTYSGCVRRFLFDEVTMSYQDNIRYDVDAYSLHVGVDETLTMIDTSFNFYQLKPTLGSALRVTIGDVPLFDGTPIVATLYVSAINHLGERMATSVKLELDGPLTFVTNSQKTITVTTSATADLPVQVQITAAGDIYCTPVLP